MLRPSSTSPNLRITVASPKSPVAASPLRLKATAPTMPGFRDSASAFVTAAFGSKHSTASAAAQNVKVTKDMLDLARRIVNQKAGRFDPEKFEDHYETALIEVINPKRAGKPNTPKERPRGENIVDLMDALRKSVGGAVAETKPPKKQVKKRRKKRRRCRERC